MKKDLPHSMEKTWYDTVCYRSGGSCGLQKVIFDQAVGNCVNLQIEQGLYIGQGVAGRTTLLKPLIQSCPCQIAHQVRTRKFSLGLLFPQAWLAIGQSERVSSPVRAAGAIDCDCHMTTLAVVTDYKSWFQTALLNHDVY